MVRKSVSKVWPVICKWPIAQVCCSCSEIWQEQLGSPCCSPNTQGPHHLWGQPHATIWFHCYLLNARPWGHRQFKECTTECSITHLLGHLMLMLPRMPSSTLSRPLHQEKARAPAMTHSDHHLSLTSACKGSSLERRRALGWKITEPLSQPQFLKVCRSVSTPSFIS